MTQKICITLKETNYLLGVIVNIDIIIWCRQIYIPNLTVFTLIYLRLLKKGKTSEKSSSFISFCQGWKCCSF